VAPHRGCSAGVNERSSLLADVAGYAEYSGTYGGYPTINLKQFVRFGGTH